MKKNDKRETFDKNPLSCNKYSLSNTDHVLLMYRLWMAFCVSNCPVKVASWIDNSHFVAINSAFFTRRSCMYMHTMVSGDGITTCRDNNELIINEILFIGCSLAYSFRQLAKFSTQSTCFRNSNRTNFTSQCIYMWRDVFYNIRVNEKNTNVNTSATFSDLKLIRI